MTDALISYALDRYKNTVSILKKGMAQEQYRIKQLQNSSLGSMIVREVTSVDIAKYRDARLAEINPKTGKTLSTSTVRLEMSLLSHFFDICRIEWGYAAENPTTNVRKPKSAPGRERRLTPQERRLILRHSMHHPNPTFYSIVVLAITTAMRQGEILSLRWEHINLSTRVAHLPNTKNGDKRDVPLPQKGRDAIIRLGVKEYGPLFTYTNDGFKSSWRLMMKQLGIEGLHFHDLRHEAISSLVELGTLDLLEIASISGHKSLTMLKRYTHLNAARLALKLDGGKIKSKQAVFDKLLPYPAVVESKNDLTTVRILDFTDIICEAVDRDTAIRLARGELLNKILTTIRDEQGSLPSPNDYLEYVHQDKIILIDPLYTLDR